MNLSNSSSSASSVQRSSFINRFQLLIQRYKLTFIIIALVLMVLISILIFLIIVKYVRKPKKPIKRQNCIVKKDFGPKSDTSDDPTVILLQENNYKTINNNGIITSDDVDRIFLPDSIPPQKLSDILPDTSRESTISVSSQHISVTNDNDDLSNFDLTDIPLRRLQFSNNNLTDQSLLQASRRSSNDTYEHPYITELKEQEKAKANERKQYFESQISTESKTSEKSCL